MSTTKTMYANVNLQLVQGENQRNKTSCSLSSLHAYTLGFMGTHLAVDLVDSFVHLFVPFHSLIHSFVLFRSFVS